MNRSQFTDNCKALKALVNSRVQSSDTISVSHKRIAAANNEIAQMKRYYSANPESRVAPMILARVNEMQQELDSALECTNSTPTAATSEKGQAALIYLLFIVVIAIMLYLLYAAVSELAGTGSLFTTMLDGIASAVK